MSDEKLEVDKDQIVDLLSQLWDTNQELQDDRRRVDAELAAAKLETLGLVERLDRQALGIGQVGILIDIGIAALDLRDRTSVDRAACEKLFDLVGRWASSNEGSRVLGNRNRRPEGQ